MSSPSASSTGPNPSSASIHSNAAAPSSPSTASAPVGGGVGAVPPIPTTNTTSSITNQPSNATNTTATTANTNTPPPPAPSNPELTARAHSALTTTLTSIGNKHLAPLRSRAQDIHANATRLSAQTTSLEKSSQGLAKDSAALEKEAGKAGEVLKGLGDLQNWAEVMEWELGVLERTMDLVEGVDEEEYEEWPENEEGFASDGEQERFADGLVEGEGAFGFMESAGSDASVDEGEESNPDPLKAEGEGDERFTKSTNESVTDSHREPEALTSGDGHHHSSLQGQDGTEDPSPQNQDKQEHPTDKESASKNPPSPNAPSTHEPQEHEVSADGPMRDEHRKQELRPTSPEGVPEPRENERQLYDEGREKSFNGGEQQHYVSTEKRTSAAAPAAAVADETSKASIPIPITGTGTSEPSLSAATHPEDATPAS